MESGEAVVLAPVRVGARVEQDLRQRGGVDKGCRMERAYDDRLMARQRLHVGAVLDQQTGSFLLAAEDREVEGAEPVVRPLVRGPREEFAQALHPSERRRLWSGQRLVQSQQLLCMLRVALVEGLKGFRRHAERG